MTAKNVDETSAYFQKRLLDLLNQIDDPEKILFLLRTDPSLGPYRAYIETFESRMVEVAVELVRKWGR